MKLVIVAPELQKKLLEMCTKLFNECEDFTMLIEHQGVTVNGFIQYYYKDTKHSPHWFEFMMTHLAEKVFNPYPEKPARNLQERMKEFFWKSNLYWYNQQGFQDSYDYEAPHPIEQLYEEFKKLKV